MKDEVSSSLNLGLHVIVTIAEHVCDHFPKRVLKLINYRLQIFLAKDHYLEALQLYGDQVIPGQLKERVRQHVLQILTTYMETRL